MSQRTNEQWLQALNEPGEQQLEATEELREELTERQRLALLAVHFQGHSMQEVAEKMGINRYALNILLPDYDSPSGTEFPPDQASDSLS